MLMNIVTGYRGIKQVPRKDIVIFVGSVRGLCKSGIELIFTDRHAMLEAANYYKSVDDLEKLAWNLWRDRDFKRDLERPEKTELYQAEALIYDSLHIENLLGIACHGENEKRTIEGWMRARNIEKNVAARPEWYF
jgi:5-methylthioribose kinase